MSSTMTDCRHMALALLVALAACRSDEPERPACDLDALGELGRTLASMSIAKQMNHVWPGLIAACGEAVPKPLTYYFVPESRGLVLPRRRDPWSAALQHAACPNWDEIALAHQGSWDLLSAAVAFEACDFARYEVLAANEVVGPTHAIMVWATHQWLLDQGLDARAAAPVTRALFAREQFESWGLERVDDLRWPNAHGVPVGDGIAVQVAHERLRFAGAPIRDHRDLYESVVKHVEWNRELARQRERAWDEALVIVADVETPMRTVLDILELTKEAGFPRYGLFVEPEAFEPTYIPITLSSEDSTNTATDAAIFMSIELAPEGLTVSRSNDRSTRKVHELTDLEAVWAFATAIRRDDPQARRVVISAADTIPLEQALAVIEAARVLPEVVLASDRVHKPSSGILTPSGIVSDGHFLDETPTLVVTVKGELDPELVERILEAHYNEVRACYGHVEIAKHDSVKLTLDFTISSTGKTRDPKVSDSISSDAKIRSCITKKVRRWTFPKPDNGRPVAVSYPFEFTSRR
jgi:hypothetical protein